MKTNNIKNEEISAFADGEIDTAQLDALMRECDQEQHLRAWDIYHRIGDVLRSDEMAQNCSTDFNTKLSARLASEPVFLMPDILAHRMDGTIAPFDTITSHSSERRFVRSSRMISGIAAGVAVLYFGGTYLVQGKGDGSTLNGLTASMRQLPDTSSMATKIDPVATAKQIVVMRDPQIDAYLIAHQQFSPSLYSTAPFARAASFANASAK